ncbi:MAG: NTP transferase domain-containing protein [Polaromonas sp.]|nr:NTP transferase domain-containing protein [Polaromonas sp.]
MTMLSPDPSSDPVSLPVVIVLAAGRGERFAASGGQVHKLSALLAGKPVLDHVLDAVVASGLPHHIVRPDPSRPGMGDAIAAGVRATSQASGWLILPGDLPLVQAGTLREIALASCAGAIVPMYRGQRGHPVRFSAGAGPALAGLEGNRGAALVLQGLIAINSVAFMDVSDAGIVTDIDTLDDLQRAQALLAAR